MPGVPASVVKATSLLANTLSISGILWGELSLLKLEYLQPQLNSPQKGYGLP